ncbi:MAG: hypothetical protein QOE64_2853 [Frankiales bacterium]|nr:hypothetical protein [Frankiales bacterium]
MLFGCLILTLGGSDLYTAIVTSARGESAAAEVVNVDDLARGPDSIDVEFYVRDRLVRATIEDSGYKVGDRVKVRYDPDDPSTAVIGSGFGTWLAGILFSACGVVIGTISVARKRGPFWR